MLSAHFSFLECVYSETAARLGIDNASPHPWQIDNLRSVCTRLGEGARELWGVPCHVNSGYRVKALNDALPGASANSAHLYGLALDLRPVGRGVPECWLELYAAHKRGEFLDLDQAILEFGDAWIHVALGIEGQRRGQFKQKIAGVPGYPVWAPTP